jgi:hypothetical protein
VDSWSLVSESSRTRDFGKKDARAGTAVRGTRLARVGSTVHAHLAPTVRSPATVGYLRVPPPVRLITYVPPTHGPRHNPYAYRNYYRMVYALAPRTGRPPPRKKRQHTPHYSYSQTIRFQDYERRTRDRAHRRHTRILHRFRRLSRLYLLAPSGVRPQRDIFTLIFRRSGFFVFPLDGVLGRVWTALLQPTNRTGTGTGTRTGRKVKGWRLHELCLEPTCDPYPRSPRVPKSARWG